MMEGPFLAPEGALVIVKDMPDTVVECFRQDFKETFRERGVKKFWAGEKFYPDAEWRGGNTSLNHSEVWAPYVKGELYLAGDDPGYHERLFFPGGTQPISVIGEVVFDGAEKARICVDRDRCDECVHQLKCLTGAQPVGFEAKEATR